MNKRHRQVLERAAAKTEIPAEELEEAKRLSGQILKKINTSLKNIKAKATLQGSFKKNTQLTLSDIDIFVQFDYKTYSQKEISKILEKKLKKKFKQIQKLHGSREYFQIKNNQKNFEIVPILKIKKAEQAKNITDVSPLHSAWVSKRSKNLLSEIKLTKLFLKTHDIYGADSHIKGFSGYACEILTIHYGSFLKLLKSSKKWKDKQVIDPDRHYLRKDPLLYLNKSKTKGPLIIIDPVQRGRNVTSAVSEKTYKAFRKTADKFLEEPSINFFIRKNKNKESIKKLKNKSNKLLIMDIKPEPNKRDVIGAAIDKKQSFLKKQLARNNFQIEKTDWYWNPDENPVIWFLMKNQKPLEHELRRAPPPEHKEHLKRFKKKHKTLVKKQGRIYAKIKPKFKNPEELVMFITKQKTFKNKTERITKTWY